MSDDGVNFKYLSFSYPKITDKNYLLSFLESWYLKLTVDLHDTTKSQQKCTSNTEFSLEYKNFIKMRKINKSFLFHSQFNKKKIGIGKLHLVQNSLLS